ncbi:MAG: LamG domain-containing protein [Gammaproteobacteria bacterium]|nr:LamG domain-containing protein [Gammaproteobacteria bacterium]
MSLLLSAIASNSSSPFISAGLIAHWGMNELSGNLIDLSGNGNDATPVGTPIYTGDGIEFDGSSYFTLADDTAFRLQEVTIVVEAANVTEATGILFGMWEDDYNYTYSGYQVGLNSQRMAAIYGWSDDQNVANVIENNSILAGENAIYVYIFTADNILLYINGELLYTYTKIHPIGYLFKHYPAIGAVRRGDGTYSDIFKGTIGDLKVYNRALSAAEILEIGSP